ncbi:MAG: aminopeptidase [Steroidobacteraceae bacterium]
MRGWLRWPLLSLGWLSAAACSPTYLLQAAHGQLQLMYKRKSIEKVLADPDTDSAVRTRLMQVRAAREFASDALGLPRNRSYRSYADIGRDYVVWNVVAAPEFSVQPRTWCFPFTGCVAYRGYFREARARAYAEHLRAQGDDVLVGGVTAYSTLGHFADPVLNTMLGYGELQLVGTMFHELAHQLVYVKGDSTFNESFAMTVEQEGVARWLHAQGRDAELAGYLARWEAQLASAQFLMKGRNQLAALYREPLPDAEKRARKQQQLGALAAQLLSEERERGLRSGYAVWAEQGLNNAHLASVATYFDCIPAFRALLAQQQGDLPAFYARVRQLAQQSPAARRGFCAVRP